MIKSQIYATIQVRNFMHYPGQRVIYVLTKNDSFKNIYYFAIQLLSISVNVSLQRSEQQNKQFTLACPKDCIPRRKVRLETLLKNDAAVTIHVKKLHYLFIEIYKLKNNICPDIMRDIFQFQQNENYNLRSGTHLDSNKMRTTLFGKETLSKAEVKIWSLLPKELRNALSLQVFKNKLKEWKPKTSLCRLCKT